jgi:hypothetical protein
MCGVAGSLSVLKTFFITPDAPQPRRYFTFAKASYPQARVDFSLQKVWFTACQNADFLR